MRMSPEDKVRLPVVAAGAEHLVMGFLMRRNILAYKAPQNYEGYDLIAIHPDPRYRPGKTEQPQVRIQVKSRLVAVRVLGDGGEATRGRGPAR